MNYNSTRNKFIIGCTFSLLMQKPNYKNPRRFLYRFEHTKFVLNLKCNTLPRRIFRGISFQNVVMTCASCWQIMHRVHLQYLYQYMTKFKSVFFTGIIR